MTIRSLVLILLGLGIAFLQPVSAEPAGTVVKRVNHEKKQVTLELHRHEQGNTEEQTYKISPGCTFSLDGQSVKFERIRRGQHVVGMTEGDQGVLVDLQVRN